MRGVLTTIRSAGGFASAIALSALVWACGAPSPGGVCSTIGDCPRGQACVDGRCELRPGGDGGGRMDAGAGQIDGAPSDAAPREDVACVAVESEAELVRRPADILLVVDSSGSMGASRARIAEVIDADFDAILDAAGIDYRVILIADVGVLTLGGTLASYDPPRLFPVNIGTGSGAGANFTVMLDQYDTVASGPAPAVDVPWSSLLRPDAVKIFLHFNDATSGDGSTVEGYTGTFDEILYREHPDQFGASAADRKLVYHAFVGVAANDPPEAPYEPSDPLVTGECTSDVFSPRAGAGYQSIAIRTGGLRFPVCFFDGYDNVFRRVADDVIEGTVLECTFRLPEPPMGETLNLETVAVRFTPGGGAASEVLLQGTAAECADDRFVIDAAEGTLSLCPEACARVRSSAASDARLDVAFGCDPSLI